MYRPPNSCLTNPLVTNQALSYSLREATLVRKSLGCSCILVYGDFNYPNIRYEPIDVGGGTATQAHTIEPSNSDELFLETLVENHLTQLVTFPTFIDKDQVEARNTLDLILTD
jgi:hypothetical protein